MGDVYYPMSYPLPEGGWGTVGDPRVAPLAGQANHVQQVLRARGSYRTITADGSLTIPAATVAQPQLAIAGATDATGGTLHATELTAITIQDSDGNPVGTREFDPPLILRAHGDHDHQRDTLTPDGTIRRVTGVFHIDGTTRWNVASDNPGDTLMVYTKSAVPGLSTSASNLPGLCDRFPVHVVRDRDYEGVQIGASNARIYVRILKSRLATLNLAGVQAWFAANPTTVFFPLAEPTTEDTEPVTLPVTEPGTTITATSPVPPRLVIDAAPTLSPWTVTRGATLYTVPELPGGVPALHGGLHDAYDQLMAQHPEHITRRVLGTDALGNEIREYQFTEPPITSTIPELLDKPRVGLMSGLHGNEKSPAIGLLRFLTSLAELDGGSDMLRRFRAATDLRVIPVGNPSGWDANTRNNHNGVNINRNFTTHWTSGDDAGSGPKSEPETQIIEDWMADSDLHLFADCHWFGVTDPPSVLSWAATGTLGPDVAEMSRAYTDIIGALSVTWATRWQTFPAGVNFGRMVPSSILATAREQAGATGARSILIELAGPIYFDVGSGGPRDLPIEQTIGAEVIGNTILRIMQDTY